METALGAMKQKEALKQSLDLERIRAGLKKMIDEQLKERDAQ